MGRPVLVLDAAVLALGRPVMQLRVSSRMKLGTWHCNYLLTMD
jgi:hypothetical protein